MNNKVGFVSEDGNYISARWSGDAHRFAEVICARLIDVAGGQSRKNSP